MYRKQAFLAVLLALFTLPSLGLAQPPAASLAKNGKALVPVVVAKDASERVRQAAENLAAYFGKMGGAKFDVVTGDGTMGIVVGLPGQFPKVNVQPKWLKPDITQRENYLLQSHPQGVYLLGATELAVEHAVWDLLYRLGY